MHAYIHNWVHTCRKSRPSDSQLEILRLLHEELGLECVSEYIMEDLGYSIDIWLPGMLDLYARSACSLPRVVSLLQTQTHSWLCLYAWLCTRMGICIRAHALRAYSQREVDQFTTYTTCMHICACIYVHMHMLCAIKRHIVHVNMCTHTHIRTHTYIQTNRHVIYIYIYIHIHTYIPRASTMHWGRRSLTFPVDFWYRYCVYLYLCKYVCVWILCIYIYTYMYVCVYIHTYIHVHIHT